MYTIFFDFGYLSGQHVFKSDVIPNVGDKIEKVVHGYPKQKTIVSRIFIIEDKRLSHITLEFE